MVNEEALGKLRILARQYCINQKGQSHNWPWTHSPAFGNVREVGETRFQVYSDSVDVSSNNIPWRRQNKARAEWLVEQAKRLSENGANESAWRMRIENVILERFSVEVACPICKQRLWRSEIESSFTGSSSIWTELDQRRLGREACKCPLDIRPQDRYEIGTSRLFEECVEEPVVHQDLTGELPKQKPDRIIGLRETKNVQRLLDQLPRVQADPGIHTVRDLVRCTPFKLRSAPLLFPFLVLEAKSDVAPTSFSDIQTQTSFPIWSLLNLQRDLGSFRPQETARPHPLVWFLGYRGKNWELYGCYLSVDPEYEPSYNIHYLRGGDIATKDGALQLLLLIDYIMDWARDIFRPSVIAQLTSLATGRDLDQISPGPDSDIISKHNLIRDWRSQLSSTISQHEATSVSGNQPTRSRDHRDIFSAHLPDTKFGVVRPAYITAFHLSGLRLTEGNVESLLALSNDLKPDGKFNQCARKLLHEITRWDEMLIVLGADLDYMERTWSAEERMNPEPFDEGPGTEFYSVLEYRCFINEKWEIIRELSYLAISKAALTILEQKAAFQNHPRLEPFSPLLRQCPSGLIEETISCLSSGSQWQVLLSALSSTVLSIYPEPERKRDDSPTLVESLGLGHPHSIRIRHFIEPFMILADKAKPKPRRVGPNSPDAKKCKTLADAWEQKTSNRSFQRKYRRVVRSTEALHNSSVCTRCTHNKQDLFALNFWDNQNISSPTAYGAVLVASLRDEFSKESKTQWNYDLCLFVLAYSSWLESRTSISTVIEDLAQSGSIYHTIQHQTATKVGGQIAIVWNLPCSYRKNMMRQRFNIYRWVRELNGDQIPDLPVLDDETPPWTDLQILLHFLKQGMPYDDAFAASNDYINEETESIIARRAKGTWKWVGSVTNDQLLLGGILSRNPNPDKVSKEYFWLMEKLRVRG